MLRKATRHSSHLVRHGRGAHFSSNGLLLEVAQADVAPHIPVKIQQDRVEPHHHPKQLSDVVMWLYLQRDNNNSNNTNNNNNNSNKIAFQLMMS